MKKYRNLLWMMLAVLLMAPAMVSCGDDEDGPADPSAADKVDRLYANISAECMVTDDLLQLADVTVSYYVNDKLEEVREVTGPSFVVNKRYEILRPANCRIRCVFRAIPKSDMPEIVKTKPSWNLADEECSYSFDMKVRTPDGKLVKSDSKEVAAQPAKNVPADKVASYLMLSELAQVLFVWEWNQ